MVHLYFQSKLDFIRNHCVVCGVHHLVYRIPETLLITHTLRAHTHHMTHSQISSKTRIALYGGLVAKIAVTRASITHSNVKRKNCFFSTKSS